MGSTRKVIGNRLPSKYESRRSVLMNRVQTPSHYGQTSTPSERFTFPIGVTTGSIKNRWTFGVWVRWDTSMSPATATLLSLRNTAVGYDLHWAFISNLGALTWIIDNINFKSVAGANLNDGNWHFVAFKHEPDDDADYPPPAGTVHVSIDGAAWDAGTAVTASSGGGTPPWRFGMYPAGAGITFWRGYMDDFVAWNFSMTNADIAEYYGNGKPRDPNSLSRIQENLTGIIPAEESFPSCIIHLPQGAYDGTARRLTDDAPHISNCRETPHGVLDLNYTGTPNVSSNSVP